MSTETGAVYAVETVLAGGTLIGDHFVGATELVVEYGWDFAETGGDLSLGTETYTYTAAVYGVIDDEPTVLYLASPLAFDAADGDLAAVAPESISKVARCQIAEFDELVHARVPHHLMDRVPDGIRGDEYTAETVALRLDGSTWVVDDVIGKLPAIDPSMLDPNGPQLPPPLIPGEGWQYLDDISADQLVAGTIQSEITLAGRLVVSLPIEDGGDAQNSIFDLDPRTGFTQWVPVIRDDGTLAIDTHGHPDEPEYWTIEREPLITFPAQAIQYNSAADRYERKAALFGGAVEADAMTVKREARLDGGARIPPGATVRLGSVVPNPTESPRVETYRTASAWPNAGQATQVGLGRNGTHLMQAWATALPKGGMSVRVVEVDPATGSIVGETPIPDASTWRALQGFTVTGGYLYFLAQGSGAKWRLRRHNLDGSLTGVDLDVTGLMGTDVGGLGDANRAGCVAFACQGVGTTRIQTYYYNLDLTPHATIPSLSLQMWSPDSIAGVPEVRMVAYDDTVWPFKENGDQDGNGSWNAERQLTGIVYIPGTGFVSTEGTTWLHGYNDGITRSDTGYSARYTYADTATGRETASSPTISIPHPVRMFIRVSAPPPPVGANVMYAYVGGKRSTDPPHKITQVPGSGPSAPTISTFPNAANPGAVAAGAGGFAVDGLSNGSIGTGTFRNSVRAEVGNAVLPWASRQTADAQVFPVSTTVVVLWPLGAVDASGAITYANGIFTIGTAGVYTISLQLNAANSATGGRLGINIGLNGTSVQGTRIMALGSELVGGIPAAKFRLAVGDQISVMAWNNITGGTALRADSRMNWIEITRSHS